jgi:hypothetical protein
LSTAADRLLSGDAAVAAELAMSLLKPHRDNLVERPWGGARLRAFKGLGEDARGAGRPIGESFEISADDGDDEARLHPSIVTLADGSTITLPALLAVHADTLLGEAFVARYGRRFPLLPKFLDIAELLSVQGHPRGNTEVYVIVAADPGATIRLGFAARIAPDALAARCRAGRDEQQRLLELLAPGPDELQPLLKPWLARRASSVTELAPALEPLLADGACHAELERCLHTLHSVYWEVLDALNTLPVAAGDVILNSNPPRVVAVTGKPATAEVHALGNPEGLGLLALEIRCPGPTFRAWDNVRFPLRPIDIEATLAALSLEPTLPEEFVVAPRPMRPGVRRSVDGEYFRLDHLTITRDAAVDVPATPPHSLHALAGRVTIVRHDGVELGRLERGESALVPARVGAYRVAHGGEDAEIVKAELPPYAD